MKLQNLLLASLLIASAHSADLLEPREWKSADGKPLSAEMIRFEGEKVTLKAGKDGKLFTIPLAKLSEEDQALLEDERKKFDVMATKAVNGNAFVGMPSWGCLILRRRRGILLPGWISTGRFGRRSLNPLGRHLPLHPDC